MDLHRFSLSETPVLCEELGVSETVTITVYDMADNSLVALDDNSCTEVGAGYYVWDMSNITTYPTTDKQYLCVMSDGVDEKASMVFLGGYADEGITGANQVTLTIEKLDTTPIPGVDVQIFNADQSVLLDRAKTDASGQVVLALDDGSYKVRLNKLQVSFTVPEDLTVSGTTEQDYNGDVLTISTPAESDVCRVFDYAYNQAGNNQLTELAAYATITALPHNANSKLHSGDKIKATYDPSTGQFYWDIVQGAVVQFKSDLLGISYQKTVPSSATARLSSIS